METHGLDTAQQVFFYEQDYYVLSNFSSFRVIYKNCDFDTAEHAYHYQRFNRGSDIRAQVFQARSAHEAFRLAQDNRQHQIPNWDAVKINIMSDILRAKVSQHEYVHRKLLATGERELVENSWRDPFWGWGPNRDGKNMLGQTWMKIRSEIRRKM
jgi:ribA/ribD-fused uncharacterized protein